MLNLAKHQCLLAVSKQTLGGTIALSSTPGAGPTFTVELPYRPGGEAKKQHGEPAARR